MACSPSCSSRSAARAFEARTPPQQMRLAASLAPTPLAKVRLYAVRSTRPSEPVTMHKALNMNSVHHVGIILAHDPDEAWMPVMEMRAESPLICALRLSSSPEIIELLLFHGADATVEDSRGYNLIQILVGENAKAALNCFKQDCGMDALLPQELKRKAGNHKEDYMIRTASVLLAAGTDVERLNPEGFTPAQVAHSRGLPRLAQFFDGYRGMQACKLLERVGSQSHGCRQEDLPAVKDNILVHLPPQLLDTVCTFLAPVGVVTPSNAISTPRTRAPSPEDTTASNRGSDAPINPRAGFRPLTPPTIPMLPFGSVPSFPLLQ